MSVEDLVSTCLERISQVDGEVGAFTWIDPTAMDVAQERSRELADGKCRGPLHGIPVGIKELFDVAEAPVTYGSLILPGTAAHSDAEVVRRLRNAGAVIIGMTRSHEFGWGITTQHAERGSTGNPWDLDRVPGGSSGGSAAAVAAGMVPLALSSDTGGSIRIPSAFCGVAGIKPSYGRIPKSGAVALAPSLDTPGYIAASVADLLDALLATWGPHPSDPVSVIADLPALPPETTARAAEEATDLFGLRIGYSPLLLELADATDRLADYERALEHAGKLGADVVEVDVPPAGEFRRAFAVIQMADAVTVHRDILRTYPANAEHYGPDVRSRLEAASELDISALLGAVAEARRLHAALLGGIATVDVLLTPIATIAPPHRSDPDAAVVGSQRIPLREAVMGFTTPQNLTGMPTVTAPFGLSADGLPVGVQVTAPKGAELLALRVASAIEVLPALPTTRDEGEPSWPR
jgi:aspartyl-tRNA(Asn)/glutamyl-tRNA(Gln) amidotransferase subunit A